METGAVEDKKLDLNVLIRAGHSVAQVSPEEVAAHEATAKKVLVTEVAQDEPRLSRHLRLGQKRRRRLGQKLRLRLRQTRLLSLRWLHLR